MEGFTTSDLGLISALQMHGITPVETWFAKRRLFCRYADTPELTHKRDEYYTGRLVGPMNVFNNIVRGFSIQIKEQGGTR